MASKEESAVSRVQSSYQKLTTTAVILNRASDQLGKIVVEVDAALQALNLGISSWVEFNTWTDEEGVEYSTEEIGYARIGGKWGIAVRKVSGNYPRGESSIDDEWLFNDAPRALRIRAIDKIPDLLEKLVKDVDVTTKRVDAKLKESQELVRAIHAMANAADKARAEAVPGIPK